MKREILYTMKSPYRDDFHIYGYRFGSGERSVAIVGSLRGDEIEQQATCADLVRRLTELESGGALAPDVELLVIPSVNPFSMNIGKRFWSMDNTDINRMFPGYDKGETTQRIAGALFESVKDYKYGVQLASNYIPGEWIPHVRMLKTGYQPEHESTLFGLQYSYVREPAPYDTALLNYNWQIWETKAFSLYTGHTDCVNLDNVMLSVEALLRFMVNIGVLNTSIRPGYLTRVIASSDLVSVKSTQSGLLRLNKETADSIHVGDLLAEVIDPYDGRTLEQIYSQVSGVAFFTHDKPLIYGGSRVMLVIEDSVL